MNAVVDAPRLPGASDACSSAPTRRWQSDVFLTPLNIRHILLATAPLALVTMAQFNVLMVRGFDISVGALMSLTVVLASFIVAAEMGAGDCSLGIVLCLAVGVVVGLVNGGMVRFVGVNAGDHDHRDAERAAGLRALRPAVAARH